jgi:hypothetical protein
MTGIIMQVQHKHWAVLHRKWLVGNISISGGNAWKKTLAA